MKHSPRAAIAVGALLFAACASSTRLVSSWKEPSAGPLNFQKVLVVVISPEEAVRRSSESHLVQLMKRTQGVASYTVMPAEQARDLERAKALLAVQGFDGAVTMRLVGSEKELNWTPGTYPGPYYSFSGYYGWAWSTVYDPGYLRTDTILRIETNVYALKDGKLVWAGISESFNPSSAKELVTKVAQAVGQELRKQGLIG